MKDILNRLFEHKTLRYEEAKTVLHHIAEGEYNASELAAFLSVYIMRSITVPELKGFRDALLDLCLRVDLSDFNTVDLCGTGGDGKNTFNVSTLASFVVAGSGVKVAKHGNYGVSSVSGSSNMLEHFGYKFTNDADVLKRQIDEVGICFLHAPMFHPAMKNVGPIRRQLRVKTFFNILGPMVNPSFPQNQLVGVFNPEIARLYNYLYQDLDKNYSILHSMAGYDEISLTDDTLIIGNKGQSVLSPKDMGFAKYTEQDLFGGNTIEAAADIFSKVLNGKGTAAQTDVVVANAAMAIATVHPEKEFGECTEMAYSSLKSGKAAGVLKQLVG